MTTTTVLVAAAEFCAGLMAALAPTLGLALGLLLALVLGLVLALMLLRRSFRPQAARRHTAPSDALLLDAPDETFRREGAGFAVSSPRVVGPSRLLARGRPDVPTVGLDRTRFLGSARKKHSGRQRTLSVMRLP